MGLKRSLPQPYAALGIGAQIKISLVDIFIEETLLV